MSLLVRSLNKSVLWAAVLLASYIKGIILTIKIQRSTLKN